MRTALDPLDVFGLTVSFAGDQAVVGVRGEVDLFAAPELAAVLTAVIDRGHLSVVLDLAGTTFKGVAGLRVIEAATARLGPSRRGFSLRSPWAQVRRLLDTTCLTKTVHGDYVNVVEVEDDEGAEDRLGPEQMASVPGTPITVEPSKPGRQLRDVTAIPAENDVVEGDYAVVALARATVAGADGVSVSLHRNGRLATVASSDQTIRDMDADEYAPAKGHAWMPRSRGAGSTSSPWPERPAGPPSWPRPDGGAAAPSSPPLCWRRTARSAPSTSTPARPRASPPGTRTGPRSSPPRSRLSCETRVLRCPTTSRLADARLTRQSIALAQGGLMERYGISEKAAYTELRGLSERTCRPLGHIVGSTQPGRRLSPTRPEGAS